MALGLNEAAVRWEGARGSGAWCADGDFAIEQRSAAGEMALLAFRPPAGRGVAALQRDPAGRFKLAHVWSGVFSSSVGVGGQAASPCPAGVLVELLWRWVRSAPEWMASAPDPATARLLVLVPFSAHVRLAQAVARHARAEGWAHVTVRTDLEALVAAASLRGQPDDGPVLLPACPASAVRVQVGTAERPPRILAAEPRTAAPACAGGMPEGRAGEVLEAGWAWMGAGQPDQHDLGAGAFRLGLRLNEGAGETGDRPDFLWLAPPAQAQAGGQVTYRGSLWVRDSGRHGAHVLCLVRGIPGMVAGDAGVLARVVLTRDLVEPGPVRVSVRTGPAEGAPGMCSWWFEVRGAGDRPPLGFDIDLGPLEQPIGWRSVAGRRCDAGVRAADRPRSRLALDLETGEALVEWQSGQGVRAQRRAKVPVHPEPLGCDARRLGWRCHAAGVEPDGADGATLPWLARLGEAGFEGAVVALLESLGTAGLPWSVAEGEAVLVLPYAWPLQAHDRLRETLESLGARRAACVFPHEAVAASAARRVDVVHPSWELAVQAVWEAEELVTEVVGPANARAARTLPGDDVKCRLAGALAGLAARRWHRIRALRPHAVVSVGRDARDDLALQSLLADPVAARSVTHLRRGGSHGGPAAATAVPMAWRHGAGPRAPWSPGRSLEWPQGADTALLEAERLPDGGLRLRMLGTQGSAGQPLVIAGRETS